MKNKFLIIFFLFFFFSEFNLFAQDVSSLGKDFWLGFMKNLGSPVTLTVRITSSKNTKGILEVPLKNYTKAFAVTANKPAVITIPSDYFASLTGKQDVAIHVTTEDSVTVFASNFADGSWDATVVLPTNSLGKNYYAISYTPANNGGTSLSEILVVAVEDNSIISITPPLTSGLQALSVTLNKGQVYQLQHNLDLTGTYLFSENCKNFALFSGNPCVNIPAKCSYCDHLYEQMYPIFTWGNTFLPAPFANSPLSTFRLITSEDSTNISINDGVSPPQYVPILKAGSNYEFNITDAAMITADKPVGLAQYAQGSQCASIGDPFMLWVSPIEQRRNDIIFLNMPSKRISEHYANVVIKTKFKNQLKLNDQKVSNGLFSTFAGDNTYSYAAILVEEGYNRLQADSGFNAYIYGLGSDESYGYSAGSNLNNLNLTLKVETTPIQPPNKFCINQDIEFSKTIRKNPKSFLWEFGDGSNSKDAKPKHKYSKSGKYTVSLKAFYDQVGCISFDSVGKTIEIIEPFVNFNYAKENLLTNFFGLCNLEVSKWEWDFGDRSALSFIQNPTHTYLQNGTYDVTLIATTSCGKDTITYTIILDGNSGSGTTGINNEITNAKIVELYPNPFTESFSVNVSSKSKSNVEIKIFNVLGEVEYTEIFKDLSKGKNELIITPKNLINSGVYFVQVKLNNELYRYKINYIY